MDTACPEELPSNEARAHPASFCSPRIRAILAGVAYCIRQVLASIRRPLGARQLRATSISLVPLLVEKHRAG